MINNQMDSGAGRIEQAAAVHPSYYSLVRSLAAALAGLAVCMNIRQVVAHMSAVALLSFVHKRAAVFVFADLPSLRVGHSPAAVNHTGLRCTCFDFVTQPWLLAEEQELA